MASLRYRVNHGDAPEKPLEPTLPPLQCRLRSIRSYNLPFDFGNDRPTRKSYK